VIGPNDEIPDRAGAIAEAIRKAVGYLETSRVDWRKVASAAIQADLCWLLLYGTEEKRRRDAALDAAIAAGPEAMRAMGLSERLIDLHWPRV